MNKVTFKKSKVIQRWCKLVSVLILFALLGTSLTACSRLENTEIVLTTGLSGDQLFKIGTSLCTLQEAKIYVDAYAEQYESVYGVEMWDHDFGGVTLEAYVKESIISQLATIKAVTLLAEGYQVILDKVDEEQVERAAREYMNSLSDTEKEWMDVGEEEVVNLFRDHLLAFRVYEEITRNVNTEVSDDEARIITVQQMEFDTFEKAQEALGQLQEGKEFLSVAAAHSKGEVLSHTFGRGEKSAVYEEVAFALAKDQVSAIVETEQGYYILKCIENLDRTATEQNKERIVALRKEQVFQQAYEELISNTPSEFRTSLWEEVRMENSSLVHSGVTFFSVYETYFG